MVTFHLELTQLWRCPVEWCVVWKGSVRACLEHLTEKHGGSTFFALKNVAKLFPPWTVTRSICQAALRPDVSGIAVDARLFHEAGCRLCLRLPRRTSSRWWGSRSVFRQQPLPVFRPSGILAVLLAGRRWEYGQRTVVPICQRM